MDKCVGAWGFSAAHEYIMRYFEADTKVLFGDRYFWTFVILTIELESDTLTILKSTYICYTKGNKYII